MEQFTQTFLEFIDAWGYAAVAVLMALENACIPIPSELILGFSGYLIFAGRMGFVGALVAGMIGGMAGSIFAYLVGRYGGRSFVDKYGKYFFVKKSHVDIAQRWFDKYGVKAVFFSRMLPVVRTFISLPAGFAHVDMKKFLLYTFLGSLPWTALILGIGMKIMSLIVFIIVYGRMIEIYLMTSLAPIPFSTFGNREQSQIGQNYLRSLFALGFQGFLIMICVGIYAVLIQSVSFSDNILASLWGVMGYTVLLCFTLFKTGTLAKSVFNAH